MIVSLHVATGAAAGALLGRPRLAAAVGPLLHVLGDLLPHEDIPSLPAEVAAGIVEVGALAARLGPLHPATVGALAACAPDLEHVVRPARRSRRELFPSHRIEGWHRSGGVSVALQLGLAAVLLALVLVRSREQGGEPPGANPPR
ncbi:MAG: hypothetical protein ICV74_01025 [Thermoleophilia bacterium]|nr:hypothetical protein [Thermoleophilia bacterium]